MASNVFQVTELIVILSLYCAALCPVLCWVITRPETSGYPVGLFNTVGGDRRR